MINIMSNSIRCLTIYNTFIKIFKNTFLIKENVFAEFSVFIIHKIFMFTLQNHANIETKTHQYVVEYCHI